MTALPVAASTAAVATMAARPTGPGTPSAIGTGPTALTARAFADPAAVSSFAANRFRRQRAAIAARQPGKVAGTVRSVTGLPLAGACVTATGRSGAARARTSASGTFTLSGLRAGRYLLTYQDCAHPGRYLPAWSGSAHLPAMARRLTITAGGVTSAGTVALQPATPAALFARPSAAALARAAGLLSAGTRWGGISGRVVGSSGRPTAGTCVELSSGRYGIEGAAVSSKGIYATGRNLPPGQYTVQFASESCPADPGNWAPQWYSGQVRKSKATKITVRAGRVTRHIDATLWHGGIVAGKVLSRGGAAVFRACVGMVTSHESYVSTRVSRRTGAYSFRGLPAGGYRLYFSPDCYGPSKYLPQWWRSSTSFKKARTIKVRLGQTVSGVDAALLTGATITGTVRFDTASGRPLAGICVSATGGQASTGHDGRYRIEGLRTSRNYLQFYPGCGNNGNYLGTDYPHAIQVVQGKTYPGIDARLRPGGTISGTVTDVAGQPLADIDVSAMDPAGDWNEGCTKATGTFSLDQLPPGSYTVEFANDCTSHGNYASQYYPDQTRSEGAVPIKLSYGRRVTGINARMQPGAIISGTVTDHAGQPQPKICVDEQAPGDAYTSLEYGFPVAGGDAQTNSSGVYRIRDLAAGRYAVEFSPCGGADLQSTWFGQGPGSAIGDIVTLGRAAIVSGVNGVTAPAGVIEGTIRSSGGKRLDSVCAIATNQRTGSAFYNSQPGSSYQISQVPPGRYTVEFYACGGTNYAAQWYSGKHGPGAAAAITVTAGHVTSGINAAMVTGSQISGRVTTQATGAPVRDFCVSASTASGTYFGWGQTSSHGDYVVPGLSAGLYTLALSNCYPTSSTVADLTTRPVTVTAAHDVTDFNITLPASGSISGQVLAGTPTATGRAGVCVDADPLSGRSMENATYSGYAGHYRMTNLLPGSYRVYFDSVGYCDYARGGLRPRWYDNAATRAKATIVTVKTGQDSAGISATLPTDGGISGTVTAAASGDPLTGICVLAVPRAAGRAASFTATSSGRYHLSGLAPGSYTVKFRSGCGAAGYATQWWRHASTATTAATITIRTDHVTGGINAALTR